MSFKSSPIIENGIIAGNIYDKYNSTNPLARWLMRRFIRHVDESVERAGVQDIHEIGCGEGHIAAHLAEVPHRRVRASDFSRHVIAAARKSHKNWQIHFQVRSIYDVVPGEDSGELIVWCEVLEHLENPRKALCSLRQIARPFCLLSVHREPLWRILNCLRRCYLGRLGNTPGHIQHWSRKQFLDLIASLFDIVEVRFPMPWTVALCRGMEGR